MNEYVRYLNQLEQVKTDIDALKTELASQYGDKRVLDVVKAYNDIPVKLETVLKRIASDFGNVKLKDAKLL